jgi:hypothetical protein
LRASIQGAEFDLEVGETIKSGLCRLKFLLYFGQTTLQVIELLSTLAGAGLQLTGDRLRRFIPRAFSRRT